MRLVQGPRFSVLGFRLMEFCSCTTSSFLFLAAPLSISRLPMDTHEQGKQDEAGSHATAWIIVMILTLPLFYVLSLGPVAGLLASRLRAPAVPFGARPPAKQARTEVVSLFKRARLVTRGTGLGQAPRGNRQCDRTKRQRETNQT